MAGWFERLARLFIGWAVKRAGYVQPVVTFGGLPLFDRYQFLRLDEWPDSWWDNHRCRCGHAKRNEPCFVCDKRPNALPWWMPFNAFVHQWKPAPGFEEDLHDHPRWSITLCLVGRIIERTPWGSRMLRPGSIVVRPRRTIHGFALDPSYDGEVWTLFIVGRRKCRQNTYAVTAR